MGRPVTHGAEAGRILRGPRLGAGSITDVPGVLLGHHQRTGRGWRTGTTVVLTPDGATAGVEVRGGGPGTRETDALRPGNLVSTIHAVCLSGGSAYGLSAADGVVAHLEALGLGHPVGEAPHQVVPVVPTAVIFDLARGGQFTNRPDADFGRAACRRASVKGQARGSVGAGAGAISGGLAGGVGSASAELDLGSGPVHVAALAVVNSHGSVIDPATALPRLHDGRLRRPDRDQRRAVADAIARLGRGATDPERGGLNTTLVVLATDARIDATEATRVASVAHDGLARSIHPVHSLFDGDTVFTLATRQIDLAGPSRPSALNLLATTAADCVALACSDAVLSAESHSGVPAYRDLAPGVAGG